MLGVKAKQARRQGQKVLKAWEQSRQVPQSYEQWQRSLADEQWEPAPRDFMVY